MAACKCTIQNKCIWDDLLYKDIIHFLAILINFKQTLFPGSALLERSYHIVFNDICKVERVSGSYMGEGFGNYMKVPFEHSYIFKALME